MDLITIWFIGISLLISTQQTMIFWLMKKLEDKEDFKDFENRIL